MFKNSYQRGFTLLEILISSFLSTIIITAVFQLYLSVQNIYHLQADLHNIADNDRYLAYFFYQKLKNTNIIVYGFDSNHIPISLHNDRIVKNNDILLVENNTVAANSFFYIANTLRTNEKQQPIYSLYEKTISPVGNKTVELAEAVESMHLKFGINDEAGQDIVNYLPANEINSNNINKIKSIEIQLILYSIDIKLKQPLDIYINLQKPS